MSDEVTLYRLQKESEELERYEAALLETAAQLKLFRQLHGHDPESLDALRLWADTAFEQALDPYGILTRDEIAQVWEDAQH